MSGRPPRRGAPARRVGRSGRRVRLSVLPLALSACAGYAGGLGPLRAALQRGDRQGAVEAANERLGVATEDELPGTYEADTALLLLERDVLLQADERYGRSSRDLQAAEAHLEVLDLSGDGLGRLGKYLYSDDATAYKAPPHEKLLLSTLNLLNYLARGDLVGARVEARRFTIMRSYVRDSLGDGPATAPLGSYLAGFTFEKSARPASALRYYDEALQARPFASLDDPVARLARADGYRTPRLEAALARADASAARASDADDVAEIVVVLQSGLAPRLRSVRFPVGAFFALAYGVSGTTGALSAEQRVAAERVVARGLVKWVNFPVLEPATPHARAAAASIDGERIPAEAALDVSALVASAFEAMRGALLVAAVTRLVARAVAGEVTQRGVDAVTGNGLAGLLAGLVVEGALAANDTPDTRSWTMLPSEVGLVRRRVTPGPHIVTAEFESAGAVARRSVGVDVPPGGFVVVNFSELR